MTVIFKLKTNFIPKTNYAAYTQQINPLESRS